MTDEDQAKINDEYPHMIVREQPDVFKLLFSWRGTILPKVLPPLGVVMLISTIVGGVSHMGYFHFLFSFTFIFSNKIYFLLLLCFSCKKLNLN